MPEGTKKDEKINKNKKLIYLVGSMEALDDLGASWRAEITPFLENELNMEVLNPVLFEPDQLKGCHIHDLPEEIETFNGEKIKVKKWHDLLQVNTKTEDGKRLYNRAVGYMRKIIHYDCHIVNEVADLILVLWDSNLMKGAGSQSELSLGFLRGIPIHAIATCKMAAWSKACCTTVDLDWESLKNTLRKEYGTRK